jgi:predicted  nucleic acid-binding Zn-ribbon protein
MMIRRGEYNIETIRDKNETIIIIQRGYYTIEIVRIKTKPS